MRWSKIKNIIILLLAAVNLCLLAMVGLRAWNTHRSDRELRERMVQVLAQSGIQYLPEEVPGEMTLAPLQLTLAVPDAEGAAGLIGAAAQAQSAWGETTYTGPGGSVTFSDDGGVDAGFTPAQVPDPDHPEGWALALLEGLGVSAQWDGTERTDNGFTVTCTQLWEGAPVPDAGVELTWDGSRAALTGHLLFGTAQAVDQGAALSASTALTRFLEALRQGGYGCSQVVELTAGYDLDGTALTPAWFLTTDVWPWRFAVNAQTGTVTALE